MRFNNPGAFRFAEWQRKFGGVPHSSGYTRFASYTEGYAALRAFVRSACTVYERTYNPAMTLYQFFAKYAPDSEQGPGLAKYDLSLNKKAPFPRACLDLKHYPSSLRWLSTQFFAISIPAISASSTRQNRSGISLIKCRRRVGFSLSKQLT